jgi:hypothetical protein
MPLAGVVTLIGVALTILVLAAYLLKVAYILYKVNFTLGTIIAGLRSIVLQTEPLAPVMEEVNNDLAGVQAALEGLLEKKTGSKTGAPVA